jgi:mannosylglycerate hydrolase
MTLIPSAGDFPAAAAAARDFQTPLRAAPASVDAEPRESTLPPLASFLRVAPATVALSSVKRAEDGDGVIVRLVNLADAPALARIETLLPINRAARARLDETPIEPVRLGDRDRALALGLRPLEIATLRFRLGESEGEEAA